jgi:hypothetical protein
MASQLRLLFSDVGTHLMGSAHLTNLYGEMRYSRARLALGCVNASFLEFSPHIPSTYLVAVAGNLPKPQFHFDVSCRAHNGYEPCIFTPEKECYSVLFF